MEQALITSSSTAICTGNLGYRIVSADFIMDYSDYILNGSDIQIKIPSISSETYSCVLESSGNTVNYRAAFQYILEDAYKHYGESCKYTLFDLDNDGVKELILSEGTCNADWINDVYCVNDYGLGTWNWIICQTGCVIRSSGWQWNLCSLGKSRLRRGYTNHKEWFRARGRIDFIGQHKL